LPDKNEARPESNDENRMLVVSDASTAEEMAAVLRKLGNVITATSDAEARKVMSTTGLEVVIVDTSAGGIDGRALLDYAATVPGSVGRVVVGEAGHLRAYLDGADRSGADAVLLKPCESQRLLDTAEQVALRVRARRSQRVASSLVRGLAAEFEKEEV
jgi:DNA-binding NtrC family response regulator